MFSKYSETRVPPNYGGSRFKKSDPYETETKSHRPSEYSAVKSSVSPSFKQSSPEDQPSIEEADIIQDENKQVDEVILDDAPKEEPSEKNQPLSELFNSINTEDLLLICLIIFLSADKSLKNNDMIILLSLLLCV